MGHMNNFNPERPYNELPFVPPEIEKYETIELWKQESAARAAIAELKGIANIIPNQSILINAIILQEAKDSSEVENIITTKDKLYQAIATSKKMDVATKEVMFYREALYAGCKKIEKQGYLSVNDIVEIQKILLKNDAGIRKTPGTTLFYNLTNTVVYTPPEGIDVLNNLLKNLFEYLNNEEDSLIKMGIIHYQFESIHPFYDGNGRTGRIINILYIIMKSYLEIPILYLSSYIIKNKSVYYDLLRNITKNDDWEKWLLFILKGVEVTAIETIEKIKEIRILLDTTINIVKEKLSRIYSKELVELLFVNPYSKTEFLVDELKIERKAASRYLHQLSDIGILKLTKIGTENIFINIKLLEILKN